MKTATPRNDRISVVQEFSPQRFMKTPPYRHKFPPVSPHDEMCCVTIQHNWVVEQVEGNEHSTMDTKNRHETWTHFFPPLSNRMHKHNVSSRGKATLNAWTESTRFRCLLCSSYRSRTASCRKDIDRNYFAFNQITKKGEGNSSRKHLTTLQVTHVHDDLKLPCASHRWGGNVLNAVRRHG